MTGRLRSAVLIAGALTCLAISVVLQMRRDTAYPIRARESDRFLYLPSGIAVKRLSLEFSALAADVYWIRTIQHYGGDRRSADGRRKYELLYPLLDLTTTLDPYFAIAYRFGAIFLSEPPPGGPGRSDQARALLEKGLAAQPLKWQYVHDLGFIEYWHAHDPAAAARSFQRAASMPGAPNWLAPLAATMLSARDRQSAKVLWQQVLQSDQPWLRRTAERSLVQLQAMDQIDGLQSLVRRSAAGPPITWAGLVARHAIAGIPLDPTGVPFALDASTGVVSVSPSSGLSPMPELDNPVARQPQ